MLHIGVLRVLFRDLSMTRRMHIVSQLIVVLVLGFALVGMAVWYDRSVQRSVEENLYLLADITGALVVSHDSAELPALFEKVLIAPEVRYLCVYDEQGGVVTQYDARETSVCPELIVRTGAFWQTAKEVELVIPLYKGDVYHGALLLAWSSQFVLSYDKGKWIVQLSIMIMAMAAVYILTRYFVRRLFRPIAQLRKMAEEFSVTEPSAYAQISIPVGGDEIGQLGQAFQSMVEYVQESMVHKEKAESASRAKSDLLASMSHEIRTPMNGVLGVAELLRKQELSPQQREYVDIIRSSGHALLEILNDILDFSKIEAKQLTLEETSFDLREMIHEVVVIMESRVKQADKHLSFIEEVDVSVPQVCSGDVGRIRQIFYNLISNAIKFTQEGSVTISVGLAEGRETNSSDRMMLECCVQDTGIGIPKAKLQAIFDKFTQADTSTSRKYGGTGLGLSICKELSEMMGGTMWVESAPGRGAAFFFTVEIAAGDEVVDEVVAGEHDNACFDALVLLAEDNPVNQIVASHLLKDLGCTVLIAGNGAEAIQIVQQQSIDLILMDCQMPEVDGYEATRRIRKIEGEDGRRTPIVALTAHALHEERERCLRAGMDGYLSKPIDPEKVVGELAKWLAVGVQPK